MLDGRDGRYCRTGFFCGHDIFADLNKTVKNISEQDFYDLIIKKLYNSIALDIPIRKISIAALNYMSAKITCLTVEQIKKT